MALKRWIAICTALAVLVLPAWSLADHHEGGEEAAEEAVEERGNQAGGKAAEHRSDRAAERSNAQWDEDNEGRPDKQRGKDDGDADVDEKDKKGKKDKKAKKDKGKKNKD